jgi:hypothetical protein
MATDRSRAGAGLLSGVPKAEQGRAAQEYVNALAAGKYGKPGSLAAAREVALEFAVAMEIERSGGWGAGARARYTENHWVLAKARRDTRGGALLAGDFTVVLRTDVSGTILVSAFSIREGHDVPVDQDDILVIA